MCKILGRHGNVTSRFSPSALLVLAGVLFLYAGSVCAKSYKCVEDNGKILYVDKACPPGTKPYVAETKWFRGTPTKDEPQTDASVKPAAKADGQSQRIKKNATPGEAANRAAKSAINQAIG